jgi:hypothetical protein
MAVAAPISRKVLVGREHPRLAPPTPARSQVKDFTATAKSVGLDLMPWQIVVGRYLYASGPGGRWTWPEVAVIVARQNGKTELIIPHILHRLAAGRKVLHAAQTRELPRKMFLRLLPIVETRWPDAKIRRGGGQESISLPSTGGEYLISAATGGAPRGLTIDDLIVDELREIGEEFMGAATPTQMASRNPQTLYLSNAGSEESLSLNAVKIRADDDPSLAYLEWSAAPDRLIEDVEGWAEANPSIGHMPMLLDNLTRQYRSHKLAGTMAHFETENLCRWVTTMRERLVDDFAWSQCRGPVDQPVRPAIGIAMDPDGRRASIALAWAQGSRIALTLVADVKGEPIDTAALGETVKALSQKHGAAVGFDLHTDWQLSKYVRKDRAVNLVGQKFSGASAEFARLVSAGAIIWADADAVTDDLTWTVRRQDGPEGTYQAVTAKEDRPITASLAAIRAVGLASKPKTSGGLRVQ